VTPTDAKPPQPSRPPPSPRGLRDLDWQALAALAVATALLLALHYRAAITEYPFDARVYWAMATNAPVPAEYAIRGYLLPRILGTFVALGSVVGIDPIHSFRVFSSIAYAVILTLLVPAVSARLSGGKSSFVRRLCPPILVAAVFPGLVLYPLSDLPAVAFMWLSIYCLLACRKQASGPTRAVALALLAGLGAGAAYNTRTIYLFPVLIATALALLQFNGRRRHVLYAVFGFALVCAPQVIINNQTHGVASPDPTIGYGKASLLARQTSLLVEQLNWGIPLQKYETSIAPEDTSPAVYYFDPAGISLLDRICRDGPIESVTDYLRAVWRYPMEFMGIYARHFINGLDVRDGRAYVTRSSSTKALASLGCITLWILLILAIRSGAARPTQAGQAVPPRDWMWPAVLVLPTLMIIPGAVETRFMLPLFLYAIGVASTAWSGAWIASELPSRLYFYVPLALMAYSIFFAVTLSTVANMSRAPLPAHSAGCPAT
jgi:hypothetical protein